MKITWTRLALVFLGAAYIRQRWRTYWRQHSGRPFEKELLLPFPDRQRPFSGALHLLQARELRPWLAGVFFWAGICLVDKGDQRERACSEMEVYLCRFFRFKEEKNRQELEKLRQFVTGEKAPT